MGGFVRGRARRCWQAPVKLATGATGLLIIGTSVYAHVRPAGRQPDGSTFEPELTSGVGG